MQIREVVVTGKEQVVLQTGVLDEQPGPGELLIESECTFISSGTELANYTAKDPDVYLPGKWCSYPWRSGYANVGVVRAVGDGVTRAQVGERVFSYGPHASAFRYSQSRLVVPVPERLDSMTAAASRMAGVAASSILLAEIRENPWVVVFGLGLVGNLAAQLFRIRGCRVIGVDPVSARRDLAEECGVEWTVGGTSDEALEGVRSLTGVGGAHISVDAVGHSGVLMDCLNITGTEGQVIALGTPRVSVPGDLTAAFNRIHRGRLTVRGAHEWFLPMYPDIGNRTSQFSKQQMLLDWMARGLLRVEPLISHRMPPVQVKAAYDGLLHQPDLYTGVGLVWG